MTSTGIDANYKCFPNIATPVNLVEGDVACLSNDSKTCLLNNCQNDLNNYRLTPVRNLRCGQDYRSKFGIAGYNITDNFCKMGASALLTNNTIYQCSGNNNQRYFFKDNLMYPIADTNTYIAIGSPQVNQISCDLIKNFNFGQSLNMDNWASILNQPTMLPQETTPNSEGEISNEMEVQQEGVTIFTPGIYYNCVDSLFFIEGDGSKRLVTDINEIQNNRPNALVANCNTLNLAPNYQPPSSSLSNESIIWIVVGVILLVVLILIVLGFIFLF